ncbi:uncharacterized protein PG998_013093 [Apiospora kogelbergensis]|uniref:uncharacterized protein n=1 Tax=Apiospora kogelbergensis TaxID=1337665 RepID=UPI00312F2128
MDPAHRNIHNQPPSNDDHETVSPCPTASSSTVNRIEPDLLHGQSTESSNNQYPTNSIDPTYKLHGKPEPSAKWNPLFLSKLFLIPFTLVLAALTTALIVLRNASEKNQGFPLSTHNSYLWTYSPTAVLVSVVSGWQQIEYWCKLLQPWKGLRNGPTTASNSVLLDYISPNVFSSLWRAGKLRHISVLAALLGGLLLKLVVVASTGLLYPIPTFTPMHNITLEALSTFKSSANVHNMIGNTESAFDYGAYALIAQNLRLPDGLQPNLAFQRFALPKNTTLNNTGSTIQAVVDVLIPQFHCESSIVSPFNLTWEPVPDGAAVMSMDESTPNPFWSMMAVINGNSSSYEAFVQNPLKIQKAAPVVLGYLAGQVTKHYAISDASLPLEGEISFPETRLIIDGLSFYMMLCGLLLVVVGSIVILFKHPTTQEFQNVLRNCMGAKFKSSLQGYMFVSEPSNACDESLVIRTQNRSSSELTNVNNEPDIRHLSRRWWRPVILKPAAFISITLLPASLVITLEILQRLSARPDGIATSVNPEGYLVTFGTRILPSIIFTIVSLFYDSFSFNLLLFAPFYRLRKQATNASTTLHECLLDKIAPHAFYIAFRHRHWAAALSVLASSVGTLFPIFISGLYKFEVVPGPLPMTMERADTFNPVWSDSLSHDGGAAVLLTSIEMLNLSFPSLTNEELALPRLKISGPDIGRVQDSLNPVISLRLPALRGDLSCAMAKVDWKGTQEFVTINGSSRTPLGCDIAAPSIEWNLRLLINPSVPNEIWVGQMQDLHAQFPPGDIRGSGERDLPFTQDNQPGCPTLAFTFGKYVRWPQNDTQTKSNLTSMVCTQLMTEVIVEATINIPEQRLISAFPDESTVKYLPSGPNGQTGFPYRPQVHFDLEVAIWDGEFKFGGDLSADIVTFYPDPNIIYDGFFALMLHPNNSVHAEELLGSQNQHRLQEEISSVYRRYMAQVASAKMRFPTNNSSKPETFGATWTNPNRGVLRQNIVSKIVLQVIVAVMFASGISAYLLIDTKTVLQRNPCTIAGMASLLVDSAICNGQLADIVSQDTDSVHSSIWGSLTFSLGWWEDEHEQERRYGIDVGQACRTETEEST